MFFLPPQEHLAALVSVVFFLPLLAWDSAVFLLPPQQPLAAWDSAVVFLTAQQLLHLKKWIQHPQKPPNPFLSPHNPLRRGGFFLGGGQRVGVQIEQSEM